MLLKDFCVIDVASCHRETTCLAAAKLMRERHTGDLIVIDATDRNAIGIITDRDIVVDVLAKGLDPAKTPVGDVMSPHLVIAGEEESDAEALKRMREHGVRRIPVVDADEVVVGIVTLDDLLKLHAERASDLLAVIAHEQAHESRNKKTRR